MTILYKKIVRHPLDLTYFIQHVKRVLKQKNENNFIGVMLVIFILQITYCGFQ